MYTMRPCSSEEHHIVKKDSGSPFGVCISGIRAVLLPLSGDEQLAPAGTDNYIILSLHAQTASYTA